jgi:hypothetical protein
MPKKRKKTTRLDLLEGRVPLPYYRKPVSLSDAISKIEQLDDSFSRTIHEHAYKYGMYFIWVKKEVGHGHFGTWIESNTMWAHKTVCNYMDHAEKCCRAGRLLIYQPSKNLKGKNEIVSILDPKTQLNLTDTELIEQQETPTADAMLEKETAEKNGRKPFEWSENWAVGRVLRSFAYATSLCSIEERKRIAQLAQEEIRDYVDGEATAIKDLNKYRSNRDISI